MVSNITLTQAAAERVSSIAKFRKLPSFAFRWKVAGALVSNTNSDLDDAPNKDDAISETDGVRLIVDPMSMDLVSGSVVDFVESLVGASFRGGKPECCRWLWMRIKLWYLNYNFASD